VAKPRGLGRGLAALIPAEPVEATGTVAVDRIAANPFQPRKQFDEAALGELAESIRRHGILHPVLLRPKPESNGFELIAGERRVQAARLIGLAEVPAVIRDWDDRTVMEVALVENLQRRDLNPIEEANAFHRLIEEFGWTQDEAAERVGKSRSHVANYLRLLQLDPGIQAWVESGDLTMAHAKVLLSLPVAVRRAVAERAVREGWTVRQLTAAGAPPAPRVPAPEPDVHMRAVETRLGRRLGAPVSIRGTAERGRIVIRYGSLEELEQLVAELEGATGGSGDVGPFHV